MPGSFNARSHSSCTPSHGLQLLALGLCVSTGCAEPQGRDSIDDAQLDNDRNDASLRLGSIGEEFEVASEYPPLTLTSMLAQLEVRVPFENPSRSSRSASSVPS